jgi:RNA polymerase-binding transcription factor DksA
MAAVKKPAAKKPAGKPAPAKKAAATSAPARGSASKSTPKRAAPETGTRKAAASKASSKSTGAATATRAKVSSAKAPPATASARKTAARVPTTPKKAGTVNHSTAAVKAGTTAKTSAAKTSAKTSAAKTSAAKTTAKSHAAKPAAGRHDVPEARGTSKDGITYTKDFDVKFLKAQRDLLLDNKARLLGQATRLEDEAHSLIEEAEMGDVQFDDEGGEGDTMVVERERDLALSAQARQTIADIEDALSRIESGTYGYSAVSGRPIPRERLEAIPWATELVEEKVGGIGRR